MPSASAKLEKQMSTEAYDPMKQIVTIVEKKVRNLEKRKGKLDAYKLESQNGKELNEDQRKAVEKYDQVVELLELIKDLQKQFHGVVQETSKAQKKAAKTDKVERQQQELQRIKEIMVYQDLLNSMGGEDVRQDFLEGNKGAVKLSEADLNSLDELYKAICPERDEEAETDFDATLSASAEHIQALLDAKNKEAFGTTYKALRETLQKIYSCSYFTKSSSEEESPEEPEQSLPEEQDEESYPEQEQQQPEEVEDYAIVEKSDSYCSASQVERPYYEAENPPTYAARPTTPQQPPVQEVLSDANLDFLQESQIEVPAGFKPTVIPVTIPPVGAVRVPPLKVASVPTHLTRRPSEETMSNHSAPPGLMANPASIHSAPPGLMASSAPMHSAPPPGLMAGQPVADPAHFDPGRPIPSQTYTNQSFHPMMAPPQTYAPGISLVQPIPARNVVANAMAHHAPVSGLSAVDTQANIYSLCLNMNQMNTESSQAPHVQNLQYDSSEVQEIKHAGSYGNGGGNHTAVPENRARGGNTPYARNSAQVEYVNDRAPYQSTNNNQAYLPRENFGDNSSYSSNLKRGLTSRGGARGTGALRGGNMPRGNRVGNRY